MRKWRCGPPRSCAVIAGQRAIVRPIKLPQVDRVLPVHADLAEAREWLTSHEVSIDANTCHSYSDW